MVSRKSVFRQHQEYGYSIPEIVDKYSEWVSEDKYMMLNRVKMKTFSTRDNRTNKLLRFSLPVSSETFAVKCSKRGNDVYRHRVYRRFRELSHLADETVFYNPKDRNQDKKTRALFATLTYDTNRCSFDYAWKNIGTEFNRFMAYMRKNFGKVSCCRVFEAYENGHPHIHCILFFEETEFKVFRDGKGQFRIKEKDIIAQGWHSYVDVKAMYSLGRGLSYLKKYLLKSIDKENKESKALKTLALGWLFNKRAFSVSGKFKRSLVDLIKTKHNSNHKRQQVALDGVVVQEYIYFYMGIVSADVLNVKDGSWFLVLDNEQIKKVNEELTYQILERCKRSKKKVEKKAKKKLQGWL